MLSGFGCAPDFGWCLDGRLPEFGGYAPGFGVLLLVHLELVCVCLFWLVVRLELVDMRLELVCVAGSVCG